MALEFKQVGRQFSGEVGKAKKALDAAKANLEKVGKQAKAEMERVQRAHQSKVQAAKEAYDKAFAEHAQASTLATEFQTFLSRIGNVQTATAPKTNGKTTTAKAQKAAPAKTAPKAKAATKGKTPAKAKAAPAKAAPKAKAAPAKAPTKVKAATAPKQREGATMVDRLKAIIGVKTLSAGQIEEALLKQPNQPTSKNLRGYISSVLSSTKDKAGKKVFVAVKRGEYYVPSNHPKGAAPKAATKTTTTAKSTTKAAPAVAPAAAAAPAAEPEVATAADTGTPADRMMEELGLEGFAGNSAAQPEQPLA